MAGGGLWQERLLGLRRSSAALCSTGLSREMLFLPSVMLNMVIARAGACWRPPFDDLVQDVAPA